jgi:FAD synthase
VKTALHGSVKADAVAVVGIWDPLRPSQQALLRELCEASRGSARSSVAVVIDPAPGSISAVAQSYGTNGWPVYDSVPVRVRLIRAIGVDAVLCVRFRLQDFTADAATFLDVVRTRVPLSELWLGQMQFLGPGPKGGPGAVRTYLETHDVGLRMLSRPPLYTYDERMLLSQGRLEMAIEQVGHPPTRVRPRSSVLRLAWRAGRYRARPLSSPGGSALDADLDVELVAHRHAQATLIWPDRDIPFLAFVSGPADLE